MSDDVYDRSKHEEPFISLAKAYAELEAAKQEALALGWPEEKVRLRFVDEGRRQRLSVNGIDVFEAGFGLPPGQVEIVSERLAPTPKP